MTGRPPYQWTQEVEDEIFKRISDGESIRSICKDDWLPSWTTVNKRLAVDAEFATRYARAREDQADKIFDEILEIVDSTNPENVQVARLRMDARKWMAGKLRPKVYGEKVTQEHQGPDGGPVQVSEIRYTVVRPSAQGD